ncbi:MAG: diguanylate cyclase [Comamonadaceae bacterium]|nr:diguanylate cyclase [Comamonadaceae bacterium]
MQLEQLHQQARGGFTSALLIADIDSLEEINAQLGPEAGDILLKQFAQPAAHDAAPERHRGAPRERPVCGAVSVHRSRKDTSRWSQRLR